jgi:toxin ParE1/3/4
VKPVEVHVEALEEYDKGLAYYADIDDGLARRFQEAFVDARERMRATPKLYAEDDETGCRIAPIKGFPYALHYLELDEFIWVIAIAHYGRRPGYWLNRLRRT